MRAVSVFANGQESEIEQLQADLHGQWRQATRAASWTPRTDRPQVPTPGTNRKVAVFGAIEVTTGAWVYRLGRCCAADFIALLD
jgi:hypothetical protein